MGTATLQKRNHKPDRAALDKYRKSPVAFVRDLWGDDIWSGEELLMNTVAQNKYTAIRAGHGLSKSHALARLALWFLVCYPPCKIITTAPTGRQIRDILWAEINAAYGKVRESIGGHCTLLRLQIASDWFALGFKSKDYDPDAFQGYHQKNILVIFDEASGIPKAIWDSARGLITGEVVKMVVAGNPLDPTSEFADCFKSPLWAEVHLSCYDSPNITGECYIPGLVDQEWLDDREQDWGKDSPLWQARVEGEFPEEGEDTLIPLNFIQDAIERDTRPIGSFYIGVDVARFGSDKSVIKTIAENDVEVDSKEIVKRDTMTVTGMVKAQYELHKDRVSKIGVDVIGIGAGVYDRLKEQGLPVMPVNVAEKPSSSAMGLKYASLRDEIWGEMAKVFKAGTLKILDTGDTVTDLSDIRFSYDSSGRIKVESKENMRKRRKRSPDNGDALAIAMYMKRALLTVALPSKVSIEGTRRDF